MSKRVVFKILSEFGNGATRTELSEKITNEYPERSLSDYLGHRLSNLVEQGAVEEDLTSSETVYSINSNYSSDDFAVSLYDFDKEVSRKELENEGIKITNIVGSGRLSDSVDLHQFGAEQHKVQYEPETSPMAVWRSSDENAVTALIPASGRVTLVGSKNKQEIYDGTDELYQDMQDYATDVVPVEEFYNKFQISNIATSGSIGQELELSEVAVGLGLERTEYNPAQFPGVILRSDTGVVCLIFRSGNVVITGNSYKQIMDGWNGLKSEFAIMGIN